MFGDHFARAKVECEVREWTVVHTAFVGGRVNLRETLWIRRGSIGAGHTVTAKSCLSAKDLRRSQSAADVKWRQRDQSNDSRLGLVGVYRPVPISMSGQPRSAKREKNN